MTASVYFRRLAEGVALLAVGLFEFGATAHAQIVLGQESGVNINGSATNWAVISDFDTPVSLLDINTGSTINSVTVSLSQIGSGGINDLSGTTLGNSITDVPQDAISNGAFGGGVDARLILTFSGLDPGLNYNLEVFSLSNLNPQPDVPYINGVATTWPTGFETRAARYSQTTGALFNYVQADGSGNLSFGIEDDINDNPVMSAMTITAVVPEPGYSALLAGLSVAAATLYRRKRR
ncbi:MAG TPA: hypothetical protein VK737_01495 [Opitutales bacterium]|jgi:hypothetical protein|nr:hypothetical protein [Opitutales bacterium]